MKTTAVVFMEVEKAGLQEFDMPSPGPSEVQVRTTLSTISAGTEGWIYQNKFTWTPTPFPCVPGYQRSGRIVAVGAEVNDWKVGDAVVALVGSWKGAIEPFWGSHISLANSSTAHLFHIPDGVSDMDASNSVVAQVGFNAASRLSPSNSEWILVYGDGLIGQSASQAARAMNWKTILVGHRENRLALAAQFGADVVVNNHNEKVEEVVRKHTGGKPVAGVLDTVQMEPVQREYLPLLEPGRGQIVYCGFSPGRTWADMALLQQNELTAHFVAGWTRPRMEATLQLMAQGKMRFSPLVTHHVKYDLAPAMYEMIRRKSEPFLGITLDWTESL